MFVAKGRPTQPVTVCHTGNFGAREYIKAIPALTYNIAILDTILTVNSGPSPKHAATSVKT
jgi:hypothetical protein